MLFRIHKFYTSLSPLKQLLVLFFLNTVFWYAAWSFYTNYFHEVQRPFLYRVAHAAWMSMVITIPLNWKKVQQVFKPKPNGK